MDTGQEQRWGQDGGEEAEPEPGKPCLLCSGSNGGLGVYTCSDRLRRPVSQLEGKLGQHCKQTGTLDRQQDEV